MLQVGFLIQIDVRAQGRVGLDEDGFKKRGYGSVARDSYDLRCCFHAGSVPYTGAWHQQRENDCHHRITPPWQPVEDVRARPEVFPSGDTPRKNPLTYVLRFLSSESPRENQEVRINNFHAATTFSESPLAAFTAP